MLWKLPGTPLSVGGKSGKNTENLPMAEWNPHTQSGPRSLCSRCLGVLVYWSAEVSRISEKLGGKWISEMIWLALMLVGPIIAS